MSFDLRRVDCLDGLPTIPDESIDAVITDPPYSSGGMFRSDRGKSILEKYGDARTTNTMDFSGDCMDARAWTHFTRIWLKECYRVLRPAGYVLVFTDWRQLPGLTDVFQMAGLTWRGVVVWDKGEMAKLPHLGYFRAQTEFVVWGTRGALPADHTPGKKALPGVIRCSSMLPNRIHPTEKPLALMRELIRCVDPGSLVLDPFAGAASTGIACVETSRRFIGFEVDKVHYANALRRNGDTGSLYREDAAAEVSVDPIVSCAACRTSAGVQFYGSIPFCERCKP